MQKHSFRDYFAPSGLVPLLRNGANRQHGHKIHSLRSVCTFRDHFVAARLVPPSAGRTDSTGTKYTPCGVCALSGATSSLRASCRLRRGEQTSENSASFSPALSFGCGSRPAKVQRKTRCKNASHFSWCTNAIHIRIVARGCHCSKL